MIKQLSIAAAALAMGASALVPATASAQSRYDGYYQDSRGGYYDARGYDRRRYDDRRGYDNRRYYSRSSQRCKSNKTTGAILGAIAGGLLGRTIDTRGDRTVGTLLGAAGGGVLGNEVAKGGRSCR